MRSVFHRLFVWGLWALTGSLSATTPAQNFVRWGEAGLPWVEAPTTSPSLAQVAGGDAFYVALKADGTVTAWGRSANDLTTVPPGLKDVIQVHAGAGFAVALKRDGTVAAWGINFHGETTVPASATGLKQIAAAGFSTFGLKADGTVISWGYSVVGEGIIPAGLANVKQIAGGRFHAAALKTNGTVVAWGDNRYGQTTVPAGLTGVVQIACGDYATYALKSNGTVVAWGSNEGYELVPSSLSGVTEIAAGADHGLALKEDGSIQAWGYNGWGQLNVPSGGPFYAVGATYYGSFALTKPITLDFSGDIGPSATATGYISLPKAPGAGGIDVTLSTSGGPLSVPATVHVDEGQHWVAFNAKTLNTKAPYTVQVTASIPGASVTTPITVNRTKTILTLSAVSVVGGSTDALTGTIQLSQPLATATTIQVKSSDPRIVVPASVTIPAGQGSANFVATHVASGPGTKTVKLTIYQDGDDVSAKYVDVLPLTPTITPNSITGDGYQYPDRKGFVVKFASPVPLQKTVFAVTSSQPSIISAPSTVSVAQGATSFKFPIESSEVTTPQTVTLTFTAGLGKWRSTVDVAPKAKLVAFTLPSLIYGNQALKGKVTLDRTVGSPTPVYLSTEGTGLIAPSVVWVDSGSSATFYVRAADVDVQSSASVTATAGAGTFGQDTVVKPNLLVSLKISTPWAFSGDLVTATVRLTAEVGVPTDLELVTIDAGGAPVTTTLTVPIGSKTVTFQVPTPQTADGTTIKVKVRRKGVTKVAVLSVVPPPQW